jgi:hypothetical protein
MMRFRVSKTLAGEKAGEGKERNRDWVFGKLCSKGHLLTRLPHLFLKETVLGKSSYPFLNKISYLLGLDYNNLFPLYIANEVLVWHTSSNNKY